jgi:uncharacterized protein with ACT and thioredoxin-like domain
MVINNKKGYLRTLEAVIAVILLMIVVFSSISFREPKTKSIPVEIELMQDRILSEVQSNDLLRNYLINENYSDLMDYLEINMGQENINLEIDICADSNSCDEVRSDLSNEDVYVDSLIIYEGGNTAIFRLYLWYDIF